MSKEGPSKGTFFDFDYPLQPQPAGASAGEPVVSCNKSMANLSILPCAPLRTSLPTSIASAIVIGDALLAGLAKVVFKARVAVAPTDAPTAISFTDSVIKLHMVLSPFIYTDETTPKKDTAPGIKWPSTMGLHHTCNPLQSNPHQLENSVRQSMCSASPLT